MIRRDHLPAYFQSISFVSDTILLFKEDIDQVEMVIKDVRRKRERKRIVLKMRN